MSGGPSHWFHLRGAGTSLLLVLRGGVPVVQHWGADLGELSTDDVDALCAALERTINHSSVDTPRVHQLLPDPATGFTGTPALLGFRTGAGVEAVAASFRRWSAHWADGAAGEELLLEARDDEAGLAVLCRITIDGAGVVTATHTLTNTGTDDYQLSGLHVSLPLAAEARELLDLTGRWTRERAPQRLPLHQGSWRREGRHGRTGHDAPLLLVAGTPGFDFRGGRVWALHVAWSGDHQSYAERTPEGFAALGGGERLDPGEVVLAPGASYSTPLVHFTWSDSGLDGLSARLHRHVRSYPHLRRAERPVVLNTWEAVYFDHDLDTLRRLADVAAEVGIERFVLDDGWFHGRVDDHRALGDWTVDPDRWPDGLHPLVDHVRARGMQFGLWVEPEMVNEDSDLARRHPDWLLRGRATMPVTWRHQQVLDLQHPDAYSYLRDRLFTLLAEYPIAFFKWDHNRDLLDVAHGGRRAVHGQTLAVYRLLDEILAAHPHLEIETCASGGARVDLGILRRTHRLWASDTNDALERLDIQRWTQLLVPPELVGQHVGPPVAHTTGRTHRLHFRAAVALLGHFGVEWDILSASPEERSELAAWIDLHKQARPVIRTGTVVRGTHPDPGLQVNGVVAPDLAEGWYVVAQRAASETSAPVPVRLPGLDPDRRYEVESVGPADSGAPRADLSDSWLDRGPLTVPGSVLTEAGVRLPVLLPESARVLRVRAVG